MTKKYSYILFILLISLLCLSLSFPSEALKGKRSKDGRYIDHGDGTITDIKTNLMWAKKGSYADLGKCLDWNDSRSYVSTLSTGGHSDWRLPTVQELKGIYEASKEKISGYKVWTVAGASVYWSSETVGSCCARFVYFSVGDVGQINRDFCFDTGVRSVRP